MDTSELDDLAQYLTAKMAAPDADVFLASLASKLVMSETEARQWVQDVCSGELESRLSALRSQRAGVVQQLEELEADMRFYRQATAIPMGRGFWCEAVEQQFLTVAFLQRDTDKALASEHADWWLKHGGHPGWQKVLRVLKTSPAYAWAADPIRACWHASQSVPHDAMLRRPECPSSASGFWYLNASSLPVISGDDEEPTTAIHWSWDVDDKGPCLRFANFVLQREKGASKKFRAHMPRQAWWWYEGETITQLIERLKQQILEAYGDNGIMPPGSEFRPGHVLSDETFGALIATIGRFFVAGCAWLRQRVVVETDGHIERHRRKQLQRENELDVAPTVRVVELRRSSYISTELRERNDDDRAEYSCRWVVSGHWRNQVCGPRNQERRLIYIDAFVKGPNDAPLKVPSQQTVYAVRR